MKSKRLIYPILPLKNSVLFPHLLMPLSVGRTQSLAAVEAALASDDKTIVVVAQANPEVDTPHFKDLFSIGTIAIIKKVERYNNGVQLIAEGVQRVTLTQETEDESFIRAEVELIPDPEDKDSEVEALQRELLVTVNKLSKLADPMAQLAFNQMVEQVTEPLHQAYLLASLLGLDLEKEKKLLQSNSCVEVMRLIHEYINYELQVTELRQKISDQTKTGIERQQRDYLLRQQLRAIQKELGEQSPEESEAAELRDRLQETKLPDNVRKEAERELKRLERMNSSSGDYQIARTHLELILELPWDKTTEDVIELTHAREVLDEDHFNLEEIKERIIEYLAVMKLNPEAKSPILCFVGPPGVGKTSLGQSIARAIGRKFERQSVGGMHDEAELRGHRRTYVGAMPGRIIQAIRRSGVKNPVLMLDELDKLGRDFRGDPAAALLEVLDPAQNHAFHDNYLDLPFDLSRVFFIATANSLDTIPRPLLDRMEILPLSGYSDEEKLHIARRYLIPRQLKDAGVSLEQTSLPDEVIHQMIRRYTHEAGVRELERMLGRIGRKLAKRLVSGETVPPRVSEDDLQELLGLPRFFSEKRRATLLPGVAAGLAWTEAGGDVLYVEASFLPQQNELLLTGQLGPVMQESAKAARSYIWAHAGELGVDKEHFKANGVHVHVPAGAIPKDGPSAGVTMVTALTSLYTGKAVRDDTAMTGEITLSGLVLPVGGIKEKMLAAHRAGIKQVLLPHDNFKDLSKLPEHVRNEMNFVPLQHIDQALAAALQ